MRRARPRLLETPVRPSPSATLRRAAPWPGAHIPCLAPRPRSSLAPGAQCTHTPPPRRRLAPSACSKLRALRQHAATLPCACMAPSGRPAAGPALRAAHPIRVRPLSIPPRRPCLRPCTLVLQRPRRSRLALSLEYRFQMQVRVWPPAVSAQKQRAPARPGPVTPATTCATVSLRGLEDSERRSAPSHSTYIADSVTSAVECGACTRRAKCGLSTAGQQQQLRRALRGLPLDATA